MTEINWEGLDPFQKAVLTLQTEGHYVVATELEAYCEKLHERITELEERIETALKPLESDYKRASLQNAIDTYRSMEQALRGEQE